ncbi:MAG TPA: adenine phosphoribosyltransferase [Actinophytocola sp.]|uniref:adenine phosphoribosyltransferase n=1 Tax=Actinophytocola sp. TaxID=1872138 RepID=UPI002DBFAD90|nr:adenine phosphoribosyltransferase [Actinophytocola sp.]HEU5472854.1 adenine phosphoribosyltransferase [Actinophytocola sp.]
MPGPAALDRALDLARSVPDFPEPGVLFWDLTPMLADPDAMTAVVAGFAEAHDRTGTGLVAAVEARGFLFGAAFAAANGYGVLPVRKAGKLPVVGHRLEYRLEYGSAVLEIPAGVVEPGRGVLVVDDVLATGGTAAAACELVERAGGVVTGVCVVLEIGALGGRGRLAGRSVHALRTL